MAQTQPPQLTRAQYEAIADAHNLTIKDGDNRRGPHPFTGSGDDGFIWFWQGLNGSNRDGSDARSRREMLDKFGVSSSTPPTKPAKTFDTRSLEERGLKPNARRFFRISEALETQSVWGEKRHFPTFHPDGTEARHRDKFRDPSRQPTTDKDGKKRNQAKTLWDNKTNAKGMPPAYGLNLIEAGEHVYLVNSELAVWLFWQYGLRAICPLGESRNEKSFRAILQAVKNAGAAELIALLDADSTGQKATQTALNTARKIGLKAIAKKFPEGVKNGYDASDFEEANRDGDLKTALEALEEQTEQTATLGTRARRDEPTDAEIVATAQAFSEKIGATNFPEIGAEAIPAPALQIGEKTEYDPHQCRELLYPQINAVSLCTEKAHAERAALYIGKDVLFVKGLGFLHYDEKHGFWRQDDKDGSIIAAKLSALAPIVRAEAAALLRCAATLASAGRDADARAMSRAANDVLNHAQQIEKRSFLSGAATFLSAMCRAEVEQFAPAAWKFAFKNRVFDKGKWRPAQRDDYLMSVSPVALAGGADRREWLALLDRMTGGDAEIARTLQDACAYALSGASSLRALLWAYGPGGTGKSTICELLKTVLGKAAASVDPAHLRDTSSREKLGAVIWGKRTAFVSEAGNKRIEAELLKTLSGADTLSVRFLYQQPFDATPTHALFLAANDAPKTDAYDDALKERVIALPFTHRLDDGHRLQFEGHTKIESARKDPNSPLLRGFAAWLADGLERLYQSQEIYKAPAVEAATAKFWADTDQLTDFWATVDAKRLRTGISKSELRHLYECWCQAEGARPLNRNQWARACQSHGLQSEHRTGNVHFWFTLK